MIRFLNKKMANWKEWLESHRYHNGMYAFPVYDHINEEWIVYSNDDTQAYTLVPNAEYLEHWNKMHKNTSR